jgi:hypothetical protein
MIKESALFAENMIKFGVTGMNARKTKPSSSENPRRCKEEKAVI